MSDRLTGRQRERLGSELYALRGAAVALARRVIGNEAAAEDACADAYVRALTRIEALPKLREMRSWFLRVVLNAAKSQVASEAARRRREESAMQEHSAPNPPKTAELKELAAAASRALQELEEDVRLPLSLHYEQGLSHAEVAAVLDLPAGTVASSISRGLERMRERLAALGYRAAPAAIVGAMSATGTAAAVPTLLNEQIKNLIHSKLTGNMTAAGSAVKGGLIVKISLGMAAVGLAAGGVLLAVGGKAEESAKPASKFSTPATDPGAEWEDKGPWGGSGGSGNYAYGYLDGPRREAMFYCKPGGPGAVFTEDGATNIVRIHDPKTDRYMTLIGSGARGSGRDGPFSRIRLGGWGYSSSGGMAGGGSSRYSYYTSTLAGKATLRRMDFTKRVSELAPGNVEVTGREIFVFEDGYFVRGGTSLRKYSHDGKVVKEYTLEPGPRESLGPYDPKNDRLYGSSREGVGTPGNSWVVWGWDLKAGGKFFGLLPAMREPENQPLRKQMATGPFKGSFFWCPGGLGFGPGDPDYRYLYMGGGDEANMYRLDLQKQEWVKLVRTADGKRWRFGDAPGGVSAWEAGGGINWAADGSDDMYPGYRGWNRKYERVK